MENRSTQIKLTGWKAVVAIAAILAFGVFRLGMQNASLQTEGLEVIKQWLVAETVRDVLPDMEAAMQAPRQNTDSLAAMADSLDEANFSILSVKRHGSGDEIVARVEYRQRGKPPTQHVRYFRMNYSMATGWRVEWETSRWSYYLAAF